MMNATEATQAVRSFPYPTSETPREERQPMRDAYKANGIAVKAEFAEYLAQEHLPFGYTKEEQDAIFDEAWGYGHDSGYHAVEEQYSDLEELEARVAENA